METSVDILYKHYTASRNYFTEKNELSLLNDFTNNMRKVMLLSSGSYFEKELTEILKKFVSEVSNDNKKLIHFIHKQAINAKYHTLFDWGKQNEPAEYAKTANKFFSLFGDEFSNTIKNDLKNKNDVGSLSKDAIKKSIEAFLEIGHLRNILAHSDFAGYNYDMKTPEEIYTRYNEAKIFLEYIEFQLNN